MLLEDMEGEQNNEAGKKGGKEKGSYNNSSLLNTNLSCIKSIGQV